MVILGLGSNKGDRVLNFQKALVLMKAKSLLREIRLSPLYESEPLLPEDAPAEWNLPFLNCAISGETSLTPRKLLEELKKIEKQLGREDTKRWAPRELDIDILAFHDLSIHEEALCIPHPGLFERPFALGPLSDLAPHWRHPQTQESAKALAMKWNWATPEAVPCKTQLSTRYYFGPQIMGILNVTPDSFSDGGLYHHVDAAIAQTRKMIREGASIIDVGAESTRPGAKSLSPEEEWQRLYPVLSAVKEEIISSSGSNIQVEISVDTRHHQTAERALHLGVDWINDVSGLDDPAMRALLRASRCKVVFMHHLTIPAEKDVHIPDHQDPVAEVKQWASWRLRSLEETGFEREHLVLDPGIGFGKTARQSLELLRRIDEFEALGLPILAGHSRKSFLNLFTQQPFHQRDFETAVLSAALARRGVSFLRVHDVAPTAQALRIAGQFAGF